MHKPTLPRRALTLLPLIALLTSCAAPVMPPSPEPARIPVLPPQARQSLLSTPSECLPSCKVGLTHARACWRALLMNEAPPEGCANELPTDYSLPGNKPLR